MALETSRCAIRSKYHGSTFSNFHSRSKRDFAMELIEHRVLCLKMSCGFSCESATISEICASVVISFQGMLELLPPLNMSFQLKADTNYEFERIYEWAARVAPAVFFPLGRFRLRRKRDFRLNRQFGG